MIDTLTRHLWIVSTAGPTNGIRRVLRSHTENIGIAACAWGRVLFWDLLNRPVGRKLGFDHQEHRLDPLAGTIPVAYTRPRTPAPARHDHYNLGAMKTCEILPIEALGPLGEPIDMEKLVTSRDRQHLKATSIETSQAVLRWPKREWQYVGRIAPPLTAHGRRVVRLIDCSTGEMYARFARSHRSEP